MHATISFIALRDFGIMVLQEEEDGADTMQRKRDIHTYRS